MPSLPVARTTVDCAPATAPAAYTASRTWTGCAAPPATVVNAGGSLASTAAVPGGPAPGTTQRPVSLHCAPVGQLSTELAGGTMQVNAQTWSTLSQNAPQPQSRSMAQSRSGPRSTTSSRVHAAVTCWLAGDAAGSGAPTPQPAATTAMTATREYTG